MKTPDMQALKTRIREAIAALSCASSPTLLWIHRARGAVERTPLRLGVFSASFNPPTRAHGEIVARARERFHLDEIALLLTLTNADKRAYEAPLEDRAAMLVAAFEDDPDMAIGLASHPFFADLLLPLRSSYESAEIFFLVGSDTLERILDREGRYLGRYYKPYSDRIAVLEDLFSASRLIVAPRGGLTCSDLERLFDRESARFRERVQCLELPEEVKTISATEVRRRLRAGEPIAGLVPEAVARYLSASGLYR